MKELVEVIARALVDNPDHVAVTETVKDDEIVLELTVEPSDMGKVIGKQGRIAKAIRSVVKAAASKEDKYVTVEIQYLLKDRRRVGLTVFFCFQKPMVYEAASRIKPDSNIRFLLYDMERQMDNLLRVGVISSTHGVKGEVKVFPTTDDSARFKQLKKVILDTGREQIDLEIEGVKIIKNMVILKFKGYDSIEEIEKYKGKDLLITRDLAVKLGPDENFIIDLIGLSVVKDDGEELGTLTDVIKTGANDVYEVKMTDGREVLLPAIKECVLNVDLEKKVVTVHMMDGLLD